MDIGRRRNIGLMIVGLAVALGAVPIQARATSVEQIGGMKSALEQQGLSGFLAAVATNGWQAPMIPSAWYIEHVAPSGQLTVARAAREFGAGLLAAVEAWVPLMQVEQGDALLSKTRSLLDVANWVGATDGYGNLILAARARDVAISGIGRLVADLTQPLAEPAALVARLHARFDDAAVRARVLNMEVGAAIFPSDPALTNEALQQYWVDRVAKNALRGIAPGAAPAALLEQQRNRLAAQGMDPDQPDPHDGFFIDDKVPEPVTTLRAWPSKAHRALVVGFESPRRRRLDLLLAYRGAVGAFPLSPSERRSGILSEGEEAFEEAARPFFGSDPNNIAAGAWGAYDQIRRGVFVDADSQAIRLTLERTPGAVPRPTPSLGMSVEP